MKLSFFLLCWIFVGSQLSAGEQTSISPVEDMVSEALARSPSLAVLQNRLAAAEELVATSGSLMNPTLELMVQDVGIPKPTDMSMATLEFRQELPFPGKRAAREETAQASVKARQVEILALRTELAKKVRILYAKLYVVDSERRTVLTGQKLLELFSHTVAARVGTGQVEMEALVKSRLNLSRLEEKDRDLQAARQKILFALNRVLDRPADRSLGEVTSLPVVQALPADLPSSALANAPMMSMKSAELSISLRRLDQTRVESRPDFMVGAGGGITYGAQPVVMLRFGVGLPIWPTNREPMVRAAEQEWQAAQQDLRDAEAAVRSEVVSLISDWARYQDQTKRYRDSIVPLAHDAFESAKNSYLAGRGDFSMVIEDFGAWLEAKSQLTKQEAALYSTWAKLFALTSPPPDSESKRRNP